MNVYTHVAMADLHDDVESLPGVPSNGSARRDGNAAPVATVKGAVLPDAPDELAGPISSWKELPGNVRSAIAALAGA